MRPYGTAKQLERRRLHAIQLLEKGKMSLSAVARRIGSAKSSVSRWWKTYQKKGGEGLKPKPASGRPCKLTKRQKRVLVGLLLKGPLACGFPTDLWTLERVADVIYRRFHIRYHPNHVWRILRGLGWSCQKPERRALQRNEEEIEYWKQNTWPRIKKAQRLKAHLVFIDESGFLLIPNLKRTWAPKGRTPYFYHCYRQDRISTINAITVSPKQRRLTLYIRFHSKNLTGLEVESFLKHLLKHLRGYIIILWDRSPIHKRCNIRSFFLKHPRVHKEFFPPYAPELNPAEHIWTQTDSALSNPVSKDLPELKQKLKNTISRIRNSQRLLWSCIYASDLPWEKCCFFVPLIMQNLIT